MSLVVVINNVDHEGEVLASRFKMCGSVSSSNYSV